MKKNLTLLFFVSLFFVSARAQDTTGYFDFRIGLGVSNAGLSLYNRIGQNFNIPDMQKIPYVKF